MKAISNNFYCLQYSLEENNWIFENFQFLIDLNILRCLEFYWIYDLTILNQYVCTAQILWELWNKLVLIRFRYCSTTGATVPYCHYVHNYILAFMRWNFSCTNVFSVKVLFLSLYTFLLSLKIPTSLLNDFQKPVANFRKV